MRPPPDPDDRPRRYRIATVRELGGDTRLFCVQPDGDPPLPVARPGQFHQLSVPGAGEFPASATRTAGSDGSLEFCIRRAGHATGQLFAAAAGDPIGLRGPYGNGFPAEILADDLLLLAGGLGIAPLMALIRARTAIPGNGRQLRLLYGAREPALLLFRDELTELAAGGSLELLLTVDLLREEPPAPPACQVGLLPALLHQVPIRPRQSWAVACGPPALYPCLVADLQQLGFPAARILLSLERRMQCGVGRCSHCAVGGLLCCQDGPVFSLQALQEAGVAP